MTHEQKVAIGAIGNTVVETVKEAGSLGAPSGSLFAAFATFGFTLQEYEALMGALVECGKLTKRGFLYFVPVESTPDFKARLAAELAEDWTMKQCQCGHLFDRAKNGCPKCHSFWYQTVKSTVRTETDRGFYPPKREEARA